MPGIRQELQSGIGREVNCKPLPYWLAHVLMQTQTHTHTHTQELTVREKYNITILGSRDGRTEMTDPCFRKVVGPGVMILPAIPATQEAEAGGLQVGGSA